VIDIQWNGGSDNTEDSDDRPTVTARMLTTDDYAPDPDMARIVAGHWKILRELEQSPLFVIDNYWLPLSPQQQQIKGGETKVTFPTANNRLGPSTGSTALASMQRMGMRAHCCIMNAGSIRCNTEYPSSGNFCWSDLKTEMPFSHPHGGYHDSWTSSARDDWAFATWCPTKATCGKQWIFTNV